MRQIRILLVSLVTLAACTVNIEKESPGEWWRESDRQHILSELDRTTEELRKEISSLRSEQWTFREDSQRWSIAEIVEHLEMQNQLHFREISVMSNAPQHLEFGTITEGQDEFFSKYATDTVQGTAQWFLEPLGRYGSREKSQEAFYRARGALRRFVEETGIDLRKQFTYRIPVARMDVEEIRIGQVRDLHQLLLTGIAHTDRHLRQIRKVKVHAEYPD